MVLPLRRKVKEKVNIMLIAMYAETKISCFLVHTQKDTNKYVNNNPLKSNYAQGDVFLAFFPKLIWLLGRRIDG